jgi:uncharacterized damage-inducible protein DinB
MKLIDVFSNYFTVRKEMVEAVKDLTQEQLDWTAPNHRNSIGHLLSHIAGTECWWIECVAGGNYDEDGKRFDSARTREEILGLLDEQQQVMTEYLERETTDDWDKVFYEIKDRNEKVSKRWLIWHVVEHQARHRGQIFMLLRMQGLDVPDV